LFARAGGEKMPLRTERAGCLASFSTEKEENAATAPAHWIAKRKKKGAKETNHFDRGKKRGPFLERE